MLYTDHAARAGLSSSHHPPPSSRGAHTSQVVLELLPVCFCAMLMLVGFGGSWFWERRSEGKELAALETVFGSKIVPRCREVMGDGHCWRRARPW